MGESRACRECAGLRAELAAARAQLEKVTETSREQSAQIERLTITARDQAKALAEITDEAPPWAPTVATVYWMFGPTRWHLKWWRTSWNRLVPFVNALGDVPAMKVTPTLWEEHRARRRLEPGRNGAPPCEHTLNVELEKAKGLLDWGVQNKLMKFNPLSAAAHVKAQSRRKTWVQASEIDRLLEAAEHVVDRRLPEGDDDGSRTKLTQAFILALFDSLLRFNEARHLRHDRIADDGQCELLVTKGGKVRTVFLTPRTVAAMRALPRHPDSPYVFASMATGELLGENTLRSWFRTACIGAGVDFKVAPGEKRLRPHDLRASGATVADLRGARRKAIQAALGHERASTTAIYIRSDNVEDAREVAEIMAEQAAPSRGKPRRAPRRTSKKITSANNFY